MGIKVNKLQRRLGPCTPGLRRPVSKAGGDTPMGHQWAPQWALVEKVSRDMELAFREGRGRYLPLYKLCAQGVYTYYFLDPSESTPHYPHFTEE